MNVEHKPAILLVCMGNICRSPTAEGVLRSRLAAEGLLDTVHLDSAGTHGYHIGRAPDVRAQAAARRRGYDLSELRARQITVEDFYRFDWVLFMDDDNHQDLLRICPPAERHRLRRLLSFSARHAGTDTAVPDPYYGGQEGFEQVLDLVEAAADGLIAALRAGRLQAQG